MKRVSTAILAIAFAAIVCWLALEAWGIFNERSEAARTRAKLPDVELIDLEDASTSVAALPGRSTILVFFTTTCEYCRTGIAALQRRVAAFDRAQIVLISPEARDPVRAYSQENGLDLIPQFRVLRDTLPGLSALFRIRRVPTVLVYGPDGTLNGQFEGLTSVESILQAAEVP